MASGYTANYGLCQWQPEDQFLREEFNQDNEKIDAALKVAEEKAETQLAAVGHDVYNLMLQNYYDGLVTGWKKALVFDGFQDRSLVADASESLFFTDKAVSLSRTAETVLGQGYSDEPSGLSTWRQSAHIPVSSCGYLKQIRFKTLQESAEPRQSYLSYIVLLNYQSVQNGSVLVTFNNAPTENILPVNNIKVKPGDLLCIHLNNNREDQLLYRPGSGEGTLGCWFDLTPVTGESGTIITPALALPDRTSLWAWVRHTGGTLGLAVVGQDGERAAFTPVDSRTIQRLDGTSCAELELRLDQPPQSGALTFQLQMDLGENDWMQVFDYGILLL